MGETGEGSQGFRTGGPEGEEVEGHTRKLVGPEGAVLSSKSLNCLLCVLCSGPLIAY